MRWLYGQETHFKPVVNGYNNSGKIVLKCLFSVMLHRRLIWNLASSSPLWDEKKRTKWNYERRLIWDFQVVLRRRKQSGDI